MSTESKAGVHRLPQIPHGMAWDRNRVSWMSGRQLTDQARPGRNI
jgi:hypothetical protein